MTTNKSSSKLKRLIQLFNPKSAKGGMLLFALVFAIGGAGYFVYKSFAASPIYQYVWNSTGIQHNTGNAAIYTINYGSTYLGQRQVWEVNNFSNNGKYMWYGPKTTIYGRNNNHRVCWDYLRPTTVSAKVVFDITYDAGKHIIWSSGSTTIPFEYHNSRSPWELYPLCHTFHLGTATYPKFEIRAKTLYVGQGENNTFKLYKTIYQAL